MRRLLAPLSRWLDRRIDARIALAAEAGRREEERRWWDNQGPKMREYYVTHNPKLLDRKEVAEWASQRVS